MKPISWILVVVGVVVLAAIFCIILAINPPLWPYKMDLQGGMTMRLKVQSQEAVKNTTERIVQEIKSGLKQEEIRYRAVESTDDDRISVTISGDRHIENFDAYLKKEYPDLVEVERNVSDGTLTAVLSLSDEGAEQIRTMAVEQALKTIRSRIKEFGIRKSIIQRQGEETIIVQLPGVKDAERARNLVVKTAMLEFKLVDKTMDASQVAPGYLPADREILDGAGLDSSGRLRKYVVYKRALLTGDYLTGAKVNINKYNDVSVDIEFNKKGAKIFEEITGAHVNEPLAIVLDGKVQSAPNISERIAGGRARISGNYTMEEAHDLAIVLRSGSLPAPLVLESQTMVESSLGDK